MAEWLVEPLRPEHQRSDFSCGVQSLDNFLRTLVTQYEKRSLGRTFVAMEPGSARIAGYYTLAAGSVAIQALPPEIAKKLPKHPVPTSIWDGWQSIKHIAGGALESFFFSTLCRRPWNCQ